ncbi:MAG: translation elongation factor Ts [Bifidobacteriaceae bacterium]|jgi:elongation factor Ts|nr:translation elongation factor Ts [Bifidobacteriaceae bacterium]
MANYSAEDIKKLRDDTGAGMLDVKKALDEANGDIAKAIEIIRVKGLKGVAKREGRSTSEGIVAAKIVNENQTEVGYIIELNSETDFVAKSEKFINLANEVLDAVVSAKSANVDDAKSAQTSANTVDELINNNAAVLGEKVVLNSVIRLSAPKVTLYLHKTAKDLPPSIAVLVGTDEKAAQVGKDVAQHIAALSPKYLNADNIPTEVIDAEKRVAQEIAQNEGKPENIIPKIVEGRLKAFYKDVVLLDQPLAKDPSVSVGALVSKTSGNLLDFARVRVGEE